MTKIDIVSGFLGAGKTTLIKKLLKEALAGSQTVLIENEFGEIGIDGGFLKESGIEIKEMNSGCICCSLVGDFGTSLREVLNTYHPERILIEPSGVGKLSDVMKAVQDAGLGTEVELNSAVAVVDAAKCKMYIKNFGEFFINQIEHAGTIILSRTDVASEEKVKKAVELIREHNPKATIITTPLSQLDGNDVLATIEGATDLEAELMEQVKAMHEHHHEHDEECTCGCHDHDHEHHHHDDHDDECCHEDHDHEHHHHHDDHDDECCHEDHDHEHHHHHDHDDECCHEDHDHDHEEHHHDHDHDHHDHEEHHHDHHDHEGHHHHHHADEVFTSWGFETPAAYTKEEIAKCLKALEDDETYGIVLRAKGMVAAGDGTWVYFDYVPGESDVREGKADVTGKICVIGSKLKEDELAKLFHR
ncbi:MAG: GTP-binding protein [Lachnospiraceae bacterium]|nr:GTP-binding protein [Lachnospiraceae bacterium]